MLRTESANHDSEGKPIAARAEDEGGKQWIKAMGIKYSLVILMVLLTGTDLLQAWVDGVLDIYKVSCLIYEDNVLIHLQPELRRLLWPIFVYSYLEMINRFYTEDAAELMRRWKANFENEHRDDTRKLEPLSLPEHIADAEIARLYRSNKYRLTLSVSAYYQLIQFLESKEKDGGSVITTIINASLNIVTVDRASEDKYSLASMMAQSKANNEFPAEDEGIPGHNPGSANMEATPGSAVLTRLKLGPLPMEPELLEDVLADLAEDDAKNPPGEGQSSLVQDFERRIKREESEETPSRSELPIPPSKVRDVKMEIRKIKEHRDRFKIDTAAGATPPGVSVCMFTFHNTNNW